MTTLLLFADTESSPPTRHEVPLAICDLFEAPGYASPGVGLSGHEPEPLTRFSYALAPGR